MVAKSKKVIEIPRLLNNKIRERLVLSVDGITIEKQGSDTSKIFMKAENISSFTFGVNFLQGYCFNFGRQYIINIQDHEGKNFPIKLTSYYRIKNKIYFEAWSAIFNQLWENYFVNIFYYYRDLYSIKQEFELAGIKFMATGVGWQNTTVPWHEIALKNYKTYFSIHHKDDIKNVKHCSFKNDANAFILQTLLRVIVDEYRLNGVEKM